MKLLIYFISLYLSANAWAADCDKLNVGRLADAINFSDYSMVEDDVTMVVQISNFVCAKVGNSYEWALHPALEGTTQYTRNGEAYKVHIRRMELNLTDVDYKILEVKSFENVSTQAFNFQFKVPPVIKSKGFATVRLFSRYYADIEYSDGRREHMTSFTGTERLFKIER